MMNMMTMTTHDVEKIIENYARSAYAYGEAMEKGDYESGNRHFNINKQAFESLLRFGYRGGHALFNLLSHDNLHVRISAATHLLSTYPDESVAVLEESADAPGFQGFTAQMVLADLKKGNILVPGFKDTPIKRSA
jgi:hypothetical protein